MSAGFESVAIRRALVADVTNLRGVEQAATSASGVDASPRDWDNLLGSKGIFTYVMEDAAPFGMVSAGPPAEPWFADGETSEILAWFLQPTYQGHGLGRKLLVHGISVIKRRHSRRALVWIPAAAARARSVAESVGFEMHGTRREVNHAGGTSLEEGYTLNCEKWF